MKQNNSIWHLETSLPTENQALQKAQSALSALLGRQDLGFFKLASAQYEKLWLTSEQRAQEIAETSKHLVILGMGGSSLGGRALLQALAMRVRADRQIEFLDNVDAERFHHWLQNTKINNCHFVIVSKSGNTIETLTMAEFIDQELRKNGSRLADRATIISEEAQNPLVKWAESENVSQLEIPKNVGGRFSVLTPVGLLPAAFAGLDLAELKEGANWAMAAKTLIYELTAQSLMSFARKETSTYIWPYADGLRGYAAWMQQLWAESLGKAVSLNGGPAPLVSVPIPALGASDQHSILQQVMEGPRDKFLWFMRCHRSETAGPKLEKNLFKGQELLLGQGMGNLFAAMAQATQTALNKNGHNSVTLSTDSLDERSIGALLMISELVVGALGEALSINAFNQPGVELGKVLARGILKEKHGS